MEEKVEKRVEAGHPDLGEYKILVSKTLSGSRATSLANSLNNMPSSLQYFRLFKVFVLQNEKLGIVGYVVKRKVLLGDRLCLLEAYEDKIKRQRSKAYKKRIYS